MRRPYPAMRSARPGPPSPGGRRGAPRGRDGAVEAIRALMVAKRSARQERAQAVNQARALIVTGPEELRARFAQRSPAQLIEAIAALRPRPGGAPDARPDWAARVALRGLGRRARFLDGQLDRLDELIGPLVTERAPGLLARHGVGPDTAALLLVAVGDHPERLRSESSWAHLGGVAPIPASSGKTAGRYRLNRGGDRQANSAWWRVVMVRLRSHQATRADADRRGKEGLPRKEIIRCLKRHVAREVYRQLRAES